MTPKLVTSDDRSRVTLGGLLDAHRHYLAEKEPDGRVVLTPAEVVPALDLDEVDVLALTPDELVQATAWTAAHPGSRKKLPLHRAERRRS
jgi:hypothetical protein